MLAVRLSVSFGEGNYLRDVKLQHDGKIIAAGFSKPGTGNSAGPESFVIARFLGSTPPPIILAASKEGKRLNISGQNFEEGARILINGEIQKTIYESSTVLIGKKAGKFVLPGDKIQVRNPNGITSDEFTYAP